MQREWRLPKVDINVDCPRGIAADVRELGADIRIRFFGTDMELLKQTVKEHSDRYANRFVRVAAAKQSHIIKMDLFLTREDPNA